MSSLRRLSVVLAAASAALSFVGCGAPDQLESSVKFIQGTRPNTAFLEDRDLKDTFLFGLNVIDVKDFFGTALNLNVHPMKVQLKLHRVSGRLKLLVLDNSQGTPQALLAFDAAETRDGRYEVDFGSAGNEISLWNEVGALFTSRSRETAPWKTAGKPTVPYVYQDQNTVVADILHRVSYTREGETRTDKERRSGTVKIRVYLKRQTESETQNSRTVGEGRDRAIGFFGARQVETDKEERRLPIARFQIDTRRKTEGQIVVYLKDFPSAIVPAAKNALLAWNKAFGFNAIRVEEASEGIDLGDPRYHVVKWFDGLDEDVPWAGYAPTNNDPDSGHVVNAQILVNGSTLLGNFKALSKYTRQAEDDLRRLSGSIGNIPVVQGTGETPVVSFITDPKIGFADYARGYYHSVIMHEFGHALGLRHNFAASTELDRDDTPSSVMDYEANWSSARRTGVGSYDKAAIRWGYFGERPSRKFAFCTDEDMDSRIDCNQGDHSDPATYVVASIFQATQLLSRSTVALPKFVNVPMLDVFSTAFKIKRLIRQLPTRQRSDVEQNLDAAFAAVERASPALSLSAAERRVVQSNLEKLQLSYKIALKRATESNAEARLVAGPLE